MKEDFDDDPDEPSEYKSFWWYLEHWNPHPTVFMWMVGSYMVVLIVLVVFLHFYCAGVTRVDVGPNGVKVS